jgi:hypothetical protein
VLEEAKHVVAEELAAVVGMDFLDRERETGHRVAEGIFHDQVAAS